jgi:hypothetical protein
MLLLCCMLLRCYMLLKCYSVVHYNMGVSNIVPTSGAAVASSPASTTLLGSDWEQA